MTKVLIADSLKSSLVMSSEVFKDKIPGATIFVAGTGEEAIELVQSESPDLCLVDFDLPDVDGPSLILALRKIYNGPILMTAFPDKNVEGAVQEELFGFNDAGNWIPKPVRHDVLAARIEDFLLEQKRTGKRFDTDIPIQVIAKAEGRGKRAPKASGSILNISLGGACVQLSSSMRMKKRQEITLSFAFPDGKPVLKAEPVEAPKRKTKARTRKSLTTKTTKSAADTKIKATVAWYAKGGQVGFKFGKLTDIQMRGLESFLKAAT